MMGTAGMSSSIASLRQKSQLRLNTLPRLSRSIKGETLVMQAEIFRFGAVESRFQGRLQLVSSRSAVARAQKEDKEAQELEKAENKSTESWAVSIQRVIPASRIIMAALVWIGLFFMINVTNSEIGGGSSGRRGP